MMEQLCELHSPDPNTGVVLDPTVPRLGGKINIATNFLLCAMKLHCLCHSWRFYCSFFQEAVKDPTQMSNRPPLPGLPGITPGLFSLSDTWSAENFPARSMALVSAIKPRLE